MHSHTIQSTIRNQKGENFKTNDIFGFVQQQRQKRTVWREQRRRWVNVDGGNHKIESQGKILERRMRKMTQLDGENQKIERERERKFKTLSGVNNEGIRVFSE